MRVLLTGGSGYVGRHLSAALLQRGFVPTAIGRNPCPVAGVENLQVEQLEAEEIAATLTGRRFDLLVHLAAAGVHPGERDEALMQRINAELPAVMIRAAAECGAGAALVAGSNAEYRPPQAKLPLREDAPLESGKLYGRTKAEGGLAALHEGAKLGLPVAVMRIFNVYGPHEAPHRLLSALLARLRAGEPVALSSGEQVRDFIQITDVCEALLTSGEALLAGKLESGCYNVCTGQGHSVAEFAGIVAAELGADASLLRFGEQGWRPDDVPWLVGDPGRLAAASGWRAGLSLPAGLAASISSD